MKISVGVGRGQDASVGMIRVTIDGEHFWFSREFENSAVRAVMMEKVEGWHEERVKKIRKDAYKQGKKAARDKEKKIEEFSGCINNDWIGY